jgi:hypothetical protein
MFSFCQNHNHYHHTINTEGELVDKWCIQPHGESYTTSRLNLLPPTTLAQIRNICYTHFRDMKFTHVQWNVVTNAFLRGSQSCWAPIKIVPSVRLHMKYVESE